MTTTDTTETWHLDIEDGWMGELLIQPAETFALEGEPWPVITWRLPPCAVDRLLRALTALDEVGEIMHDRSGEGPSGHLLTSFALGQALQRLRDQGRVTWGVDDAGTFWHDIPRDVGVTP